MMNSAADGRMDRRPDDFIPLRLAPGLYTVATAYIACNHFHRFTYTAA
jgi:hypothetical protein